MDDRRKTIRIPVATVANISPHGLQSSVKVTVRDLSTSGMGCLSDFPFKKGDMLLVKIQVTTHNFESFIEKLTGRVAWSSKAGANRYALGVEFHDVETRNPKLHAYILELENILDPR